MFDCNCTKTGKHILLRISVVIRHHHCRLLRRNSPQTAADFRLNRIETETEFEYEKEEEEEYEFDCTV